MHELQEFERYLEHLGAGLKHADRQAGLRGYCTALMAPLARKSVEPMAAHLAPQATRARHQSLHHFVAQLRLVRRRVAAARRPVGRARHGRAGRRLVDHR